MRLDKNHLDQFENIQPPMRAALTLPVIGKEGITVYVCASPFARAKRGLMTVHKDVLEVATALAILLPSNTELQGAIDEAKAALVGDSNDAEHDALVSLIKALGEGDVPECECGAIDIGEGNHKANCPAKAWEGGGQ